MPAVDPGRYVTGAFVMSADLTAHPSEGQASRLSIAYLLCLMAGVGIAIATVRAIEHMRFPADSWYYRATVAGNGSVFGLVVASIYGLCLITFLFAIRAGRIWDSPGKVLALLFTAMCVLDWGLEASAATIVSYRVEHLVADGSNVARGVATPEGYVFGIWYRAFAATVGYVAAFPLLVLVCFKTRRQTIAWRIAWLGFVIFDLLVIADIYLRARELLPGAVRDLYFELAIGLPMVLTAVALLYSLVRRLGIDWWTTVIAAPTVGFWVVVLGTKLMAITKG